MSSDPGNEYGAAHTIDPPLLFGDEQTWADTGLVAGAAWEEIDAHGRQLRRFWLGFARGEDLGEAGRILGPLRHRRARP